MQPYSLDATFAALADPTRRAILARLAQSEASVSELAKPFVMSQPAISKHLKVLEQAGLISRGRDAQRRPCRIEARPLADANEWLENYRQIWEANFGRLDSLLNKMKSAERDEKPEAVTTQEKTTMLDQPSIVQTNVQHTAVIRFTIPREEIRNVMGPAMQEVMTTLAAQGISPAGPLFSHHFRMDPAIFDFEVGAPIATPVTPAGRVEASQLPATKVARTTYSGPYEGLGDAWGEFGEWITSEGHTPAQDLWECYVSGPESSPDPSAWHTELNRPLVEQ